LDSKIVEIQSKDPNNFGGTSEFSYLSERTILSTNNIYDDGLAFDNTHYRKESVSHILDHICK
jgi:hypothetical protein